MHTPSYLFSLIKRHSAFVLLPMLLFLLVGCGDKPERHLDLGLWYYEKGLVDDAILEFKEVIRLLPGDPRRLNVQELDLVARAHYNLAVAYTKKDWFEMALVEAEQAFELRPTQENYRLQELIRQRQDLESISPTGGTSPG